ncbi:MAG TPA: C25 family cysteine peptidase, partial [Bacteroidales bacterium]|nr:C25 family cysteine peptidase [Bacteroidales bacterium]
MRKNSTFSLIISKVMPFVIMLIIGVSLTFRTIAQEFAIDLGTSLTATEIKEDNIQTLRVQYVYEGINTFGVAAKGMVFNEIFMPNTFWTGELGTPKLPASKDLIEIPFGAEVKVRVNSYDVTEYTLSDFGIEHPIMPVQRSVRKDQNVDEIPFEFRADIYSKDAFVKHELASVEILGVLRGIRIARLTVAPVSYNPVKGVIRVYNNIDVELSFSNVDVALNQYIKASTHSHYFDVVRNAILNNPNHGYPAHPDLTKYPVKYLIVSHRMFENQLAPFIAWKTKKGYEVVVAYTDVIGTTFTQIQQWVHTQYNAGTPTDPAPSFLLLVGDVQQVPSLMGTSSGKMTDLYYASVDGDFFPEMYYGRFSAQNINHLISQIDKTLFYEKYEFTDPTYLNKVTLIAGADAFWNPNVGQPTVHYGTNNYFNAANGFTDIHIYLTSPYTGCYGPSRIAVGFINYTAHCNQTSWGDPLLSQTMVNNFTNAGLYPLAIGNCCLAADFGFNECIGETWQRAANKGSVAYIGSSPNSYWFEDFYWAVGAFPIVGNNSGYVPTYAETTWGAYDAPFVSNYVTTGAFNFVGNLAVTEVDIQGYASHSSPLYYWQAYNVLGDPSLVPFFTQASVNTVTHLPILPIGLNTYEVSASPGSYVAISKSGVLHGAALVGSTGTVTVNIDPVLTAGPVDIVVTKPQFIPYMVQVPAAALVGPYVLLDSFTINDSTGNNNGLADYGETIKLNVTLKNVGSDPSGIVTATVTGTNQHVTLTGPASAAFGPIPAGGSVTVSNAYTFQIADFVPNQHEAIFILNMVEGSNLWTSNLRITLQAPVLNIPASFIINDAQSGNNNGILDPGETALITVEVENNGSSNVSNGVLNITSPDPLLIINNPTVTIGSIAAGASVDVSFSVTADPSTTSGYPVNVGLLATAGPSGVYSANRTITVVIGLIPTYNISNTTVTTCVGLFYDSGGAGSNYANNEDFTMTFLPHFPGAMVRANFLSFNTESVHDQLFVYNGTNTNAPQFPGSPFTGTTNPGMFTAQNASGAITFRFTSDGSVVRPGWEAEISCYMFTSPPPCASNPTPSNGASNVALNSQLGWTASDATHFDLYFGTSMNPPYL